MSDCHKREETAPLLNSFESTISQKQAVPEATSQKDCTIQTSAHNKSTIVESKLMEVSFCTNSQGLVESCQGYAFTTNGQLLNVESKEGFKFTNQQEYEDLGEWVGEAIYAKMTQEPYNLQKIYLKDDLDDVPEESLSFVFASPELQKARHLVVIIHGTGVVRAGQWSRKLIMNESLGVGSQLPFIRHCQLRGWSVLVMNTNDNYYYFIPHGPSSQPCSSSIQQQPETIKEVVVAEVSKELIQMPGELAVESGEVVANIAEEVKDGSSPKRRPENANDKENKGEKNQLCNSSSPIKVMKEKKRKLHSGSAEEHGLYVWENFVQPLSYHNHELKIAIVAHSYGGRVTMEILSQLANRILHIDDNHQDTTSALDCLNSIKSICLTDAIFDEPILSWLKPTAPKTRNWISSSLPVDTKLPRRGNITFSAGTDEHERTSAAARRSIFKFIEVCFEEEED